MIKTDLISFQKLTGLQEYTIHGDTPYGLSLNVTTLPQHLNSLGYKSHMVGKWHLGHFNKEHTPTYRGFASHSGYWTGKEDYYSHINQEGVGRETHI